MNPQSVLGHPRKKVSPGILDGVPVEFETFLAEPAFSLEETRFVFGDDTLIQLRMLEKSTTLMQTIQTDRSIC